MAGMAEVAAIIITVWATFSQRHNMIHHVRDLSETLLATAFAEVVRAL